MEVSIIRKCPNKLNNPKCHLIIVYTKLNNKKKADQYNTSCRSCIQFIGRNNKCKNEECYNTFSQSSKSGYCAGCSQAERNRIYKESIKNIKYTRICPNPNNNTKCTKTLLYNSKGDMDNANKNNSYCRSCTGRIARGKPNIEIVCKYCKNIFIEPLRNEHRVFCSIICARKINKGKKYEDIYGKSFAKELKLKIQKAIVISAGNKWINYNKQSIPLIEQYGKENGYNFRHAENHPHGEFMSHSYFADGYDQQNNVWIEYDEKGHFDKNGILKKEDIIRQKNIIRHLKCKFIRIKYDGTIAIY